jgi:hypothetical protein
VLQTEVANGVLTGTVARVCMRKSHTGVEWSSIEETSELSTGIYHDTVLAVETNSA